MFEHELRKECMHDRGNTRYTHQMHGWPIENFFLMTNERARRFGFCGNEALLVRGYTFQIRLGFTIVRLNGHLARLIKR